MSVVSFSDLRDVEFHDAVLIDIFFSVRGETCVVKLEMYDTKESQDRVAVTLSFEGVASCLTRLDFPALFDNSSAGNVQNCRVDVGRGVVRLYLVDGLIEISARSTRLTRG